jgi:hypothetical protein
MATVWVRIVILTVWITLSVYPFNPMAHLSTVWAVVVRDVVGYIECL